MKEGKKNLSDKIFNNPTSIVDDNNCIVALQVGITYFFVFNKKRNKNSDKLTFKFILN